MLNFRRLAAKLFLLATTALVCADLATANELPKKKKHYGPLVHMGHAPSADINAFSWTGFHIGIGGGASFLRSASKVHAHTHQQGNNGGYFETYTSDQMIDQVLQGTGGFGTVAAGYDRRSGNVVLGGFADLSFGSVSASTSVTDNTHSRIDELNVDFPATATLSHVVSMSNDATLGARVGFLANDKTLFYALGGFSLANVNVSSKLDVTHGLDSALSNFSLGTSYQGWKPGFTVGTGVEFVLSEHLTLQAEYRYSNYGNIQSNNAVTLSDGSSTISQNVDLSDQTVRAILQYHF